MKLALSFDIEEFDMPFEYGGEISFAEQISISRAGTENILKLLKKHNITATFFSTVVFAHNNRDLIEKIVAEGHEIASHTWFHSNFKEEHLRESREELEKISGQHVVGLRMPRMREISATAVAGAGYLYNSSVNPTYLPGRYNNLKISRTLFMQGKLQQIPASVSPLFRIPLFWLSFHNFPLALYQSLSLRTLKKDGYLNIYFHPWEFADISCKKFKLPAFTTRNTGEKMVLRFGQFLNWINRKGVKSVQIKELAQQKL